MKTLPVIAACCALAFVLAPAADAAVLKTNWNELQTFSDTSGGVRVYVRKIAITPGTWKAWVGITNASAKRVTIAAHVSQGANDGGTDPFVFYAGPGIWWQTYKSGTSWWPGSGTSVTHAARADRIAPAVPSALAARRSWFGTFTGSTAKLPKGRLLRIGFGIFRPTGGSELLVSTTHQFKLPKL